MSPPRITATTDAPDGADERDIVAAVGAGDLRGAITLLMQRYGHAVYRYCRQMIGDAARADDVHQQVFVAAYQDLARYAGRSSLRSWLFGIARHRCLDAVKGDRRWTDRYKQTTSAEPADPAPTAEVALDDERLTAALARCLDTLAPATRMAVLLRYQEGFSYEEMARICRERAGTLQQRVARAMPVLRACVEARTGGRL